jgi:restriction endonuclease S subunit
MKLGQLCDIRTNFPEADFWLIRKGNDDEVGKPTKEFSPENIGIKVIETDILFPQYLYYALLNLFNQGKFINLSTGTLRLKHIRTEDIKNIKFG